MTTRVQNIFIYLGLWVILYRKNNHVVRMLIVNLFASIEGINYISIINKNYNCNIKIG